MLTNDLLSRAVTFRRALELYRDSGDAIGNLQEFPNECCEWASRLCGWFLLESGCGVSTAVLGRRGQRKHWWLEHNCHTIDLTADQFVDDLPAVLVATESPWHAEWRVEERCVIDYNDVDLFTAPRPGDVWVNAYAGVLEQMNRRPNPEFLWNNVDRTFRRSGDANDLTDGG